MGNLLASLEEAHSADNNEQQELDEENEEKGEQVEEQLEEGYEEEEQTEEIKEDLKDRDKEKEEELYEKMAITSFYDVLFFFYFFYLEGIMWPTHIMERQEFEFKQKLINALTTKSFCHDENDTLFAMATKRSPITREQSTRHQEVSYTCEHDMGKSFFDNNLGGLQ
ncbi:hypothetical protein PR202_gb14835 [Eleusine coracana subsp. coracana]|uniref:Uncharacterized protein n=1 Tax=Eleusine coracana subsp. coracana TaxID=191504 RepID=A0AAV5EWE7_ELECO|nr:hypothetical protein PR202_gb14835 [Eleusine coracana subsp. coracana]